MNPPPTETSALPLEEHSLMLWLTRLPFVTASEAASILRMDRSQMSRYLARADRAGLVRSVPHAPVRQKSQ